MFLSRGGTVELVVIPNSVDEISFYQEEGSKYFILGLENYCINYPSVSLEKIKELSSKYSLFISINKNIFNSELSDLKEKLLELSHLSIMGILFYDLGVLNIVRENNIPVDLVWHQTHMVTNYNTCNFYYEKGVKFGFLANEITLEEILEIKKRTNMKLMVECFGYPIMSHSRRMLLTNYFKSIGKKKEDRVYHLENMNEDYLLKESKDGASILYGKLINGVKPLFDLVENNIDYAVLDMQEVEKEIGKKVLSTYSDIIKNHSFITIKEKSSIIDEMNDLIGDNTNFFYKKTIYKVKKGDK